VLCESKYLLMEKLLVSACLLGDPVRYDGRSKSFENSALQELVKQDRVIAFCPEVAGGLPTPRDTAEIQQGDGVAVIDRHARVTTINDDDVTDFFLRGADLALNLCQQHRLSVAILTESSPSCGSKQIYDGSFSRTNRQGVGVTTALLKRHGIAVFSQYQIGAAINSLADRN
jgi:uncharacterized protein YbbK (DUF523 family)